MTKLCCLNQDNPLFLRLPSVVFTGSLLVVVGDETRMQLGRVIADGRSDHQLAVATAM